MSSAAVSTVREAIHSGSRLQLVQRLGRLAGQVGDGLRSAKHRLAVGAAAGELRNQAVALDQRARVAAQPLDTRRARRQLPQQLLPRSASHHQSPLDG